MSVSSLAREPFIPARFESVIAVHSYAGGSRQLYAPLILGIHGPPGNGKSYQARAVAVRNGFRFSAVSASVFSGTLESEPIVSLEEEYVKLALMLDRYDCAGFLLVDDFDMGISGLRDNATYTVNSQLLNGFLMGLCDDPLIQGRLKRAVPIVITGNNLQVLYSPLTRHGRMRAFEWIPTIEEKVDVVSNLMQDALDAQDVRTLVEKFPGQPISFFHQVLVELWWREAGAAWRSHHHAPSYSQFVRDLNAEDQHGTLESYIETGNRLINSTEFVDHLSSDLGWGRKRWHE